MNYKKLNYAVLALAFLVATLSGVAIGIYATQSQTTNALEKLGDHTLTSNAPVLAVSSQTGEGILSSVSIEIQKGRGRVLINTNPFVEPDTQYSADTAVRIAQEITKKELTDRDVIFTFDPISNLVGGPSAGAALTLGTIAAIQGKQLRQDTAITGTINEDGTIGSVGGIFEKTKAAADAGKKFFIVPTGQEKLNYLERQIEQTNNGPFVFERTTYIPRTLDLTKYASDEWGIELKTAATIEEAMSLMLEN
ncbi:MAG: S16 family serine protease [Candidatus Micrarchaeota archaeon]